MGFTHYVLCSALPSHETIPALRCQPISGKRSVCVQRSTILGTPVTKGPLVTLSVIVSAVTYLLRNVRVTPALAIAPVLFCLNEMTLKKDFLGESIRYQDKKRTLR